MDLDSNGKRRWGGGDMPPPHDLKMKYCLFPLHVQKTRPMVVIEKPSIECEKCGCSKEISCNDWSSLPCKQGSRKDSLLCKILRDVGK